MRPYYDHAGITIYHADCREVLPTLAAGSVDLVLTDPPYLNFVGGLRIGHGVLAEVTNETVSVGDPWGANLNWASEAWRVARFGAMVFCGFASLAETRLAFPGAKTIGLVTWFKRNAPPPVANVPHYDAEYVWLLKKAPGLIWRNLDSTVFDIPTPPAGCMRSERVKGEQGKAAHPTQKPLELVKRLMVVEPSSVCDPFLGSGTTAVAAKLLGRRCIGIEIEERYCEIAARRLDQEVLPLDAARAPMPAQLALEV
jgi:site-specific DNA-methyltransferase (adenine-specific)